MRGRHCARAPRQVAASVLTLAVVFAGCGDSETTQDEDSSRAQLTAPITSPDPDANDSSNASVDDGSSVDGIEPSSAEPIKLMVIYPSQGTVPLPEAPEGAQAAASAINATGGITGRRVEILTCDEKDDPNLAAECGRRAVDEGVDAVVGSFSLHGGEFLPILEQAGIASVGTIPAAADDFSSSVVFPILNAPGLFAASAAELVRKGASTIALAHLDIPAAGAFAPWMDLGLAPVGKQVTTTVAVPPGAPDMAAYATAVLADGADGVMVGLSGQDAINFIVALKQEQPDVLVALSTDGVDRVIAALHEALGPDSDGIIRTSSLPPADLPFPAYADFARDMEDAGFDTGGDNRIASYAAVRLVEAVASALNDVDGPAILDALRTATGIRIGLVPPLQFVEGGLGGIPRIFNPCVFTLEAVDGVLVPGDREDFFDPFTGADCPAP